MPRNPGSPDSTTVERLAGGQVDPADAPPGFRLVAGLLQEAGRIPAADRVSADDETTVHAMVAAIASAASEGIPAGSPRRRPARRLTKVLAAATFATLASGGVAAASGGLPDPLQDAVSNAVGIVGVEIPRGNAYGHLDKAEKDAAKEADKADRAEAREEKQSSQDDKGARPSDQGENQGQGEEISGIAHDPALEGVDKGSCVADAASDGKSNAAEQSEATCPPGDPQTTETPAEDGEEAPKGEKPEDLPAGPEQGESVSVERSKGASSARGDHGAPAELPKGGPS